MARYTWLHLRSEQRGSERAWKRGGGRTVPYVSEVHLSALQNRRLV